MVDIVAGSIADIMPHAETASSRSIKELLNLRRGMVPECVRLLENLHSMNIHHEGYAQDWAY